MAVRGKGAEWKAGIVVLAGLIILILGLFLVSGGFDMFRAKRFVKVLFLNAGGIKPGDEVSLAGREIGEIAFMSEREVTWDLIRPLDGDGDGRITREEFVGPEGVFRALDRVTEEGEDKPALTAADNVRRIFVEITAELQKKARISTDSLFKVSKTITGVVEMNIEYGDPEKPATDESLIFGKRLANFEEVADNANVAIDEVRIVISEAKIAMKTVNEKIADFDIGAVQGPLVKLAEDVERRADGWFEDIDATIQAVRDGTEHFRDLGKALKSDWKEMQPGIDKTIRNVESASGEVDGIVKENRDGIRELVENLRDASRRVAPVLLKVESLSQAVEATVVESRPKLTDGLEKARTAMGNFEALTEDLRTAPWKLLNKPSADETRQVHLYNAARLYVDAATRVQNAIDDLDALRRDGAFRDEEKAALVQESLGRLERSLRRFDEHQEKLVEILVGPD
jgi:hypothetical protein